MEIYNENMDHIENHALTPGQAKNLMKDETSAEILAKYGSIDA